MKIVSYNINGIRASVKQGLIDFVKSYDADIYCFQEVRCDEAKTKELLFGKAQTNFFETPCELGYFATFNCGNIPGYAGTMTLSKELPDRVERNMGKDYEDDEGRTLTIFFKKLAIVNAYIPNGNSRLEFKMAYLKALSEYIAELKTKYDVICVGDFNIAHNEIDLTNPKQCSNKSVFLPIERKAMSELLGLGFIDVFRHLNPQTIKYSWRSYRSAIAENDPANSFVGWKYRIDYVIASRSLEKDLISCDILDVNYSDHLPVVAQIK